MVFGRLGSFRPIRASKKPCTSTGPGRGNLRQTTSGVSGQRASENDQPTAKGSILPGSETDGGSPTPISSTSQWPSFPNQRHTTTAYGQFMYDLWTASNMRPPTLMAEVVWTPIFEFISVGFTPNGHLRTEFRSRPDLTYTIEFADDLSGSPMWNEFSANGSFTATNTMSWF
jgi:hypothetical protein